MNTPRFNLLLAIGFSWIGLFAQNHKELGLEGRISEKSAYYIKKVIDCRSQLENSSIVYDRDDLYDPNDIKIPTDLNNYILDDLQFAGPDSNSNIPIIVKINWLELERKRAELFINLNVDFYINDSGTFYHEFSAGEFMAVKNVFDADDPLLRDQTKKLLESVYAEFLHRMENHLGYHATVEMDELYKNSLLSKELSPDFSNRNVDGIYYTYNLFVDDIKDVTTGFTEGKRDISKYSPYEKNFKFDKIEMNDVWGVSHSGLLYIRYGEGFYPMVKIEDNYVICTKEVLKVKSRKRIEDFDGFGLINHVSDVLTDASTEVVLIDRKLDIISGNWIYSGKSDGLPAQQGVRIIVILPDDCTEKVGVYFDNKKVAELKTDSYYMTSIEDNNSEHQLCVKSIKNSSCVIVETHKKRTFYFEVFIDSDENVSLEKIMNMKQVDKYERWMRDEFLMQVN